MTLDTKRRKHELRTSLRARREALAPAAAADMGTTIQRRVIALDAWRHARNVLGYVAVRNEVGTDLLLEAAWRREKTLLLPRCAPLSQGESGRGCMDCCCVSSPEQLVPGAYAIPEPDPAQCPLEENPSLDLALIPAVAFDRRGMRLGQGGGYYDRMLAGKPMHGTLLIGLAYDFQLVDELPAEPWDMPVHCICTEKETLWL